MADVYDKIRLLDLFRLNPEMFLPLVDHAWKVFPKVDPGKEWYDDKQVNIGWDTGLLEGNRPYFLEAWATCGITMLTYFVSTKEIEGASGKDLVKMLTGAKLVLVPRPLFTTPAPLRKAPKALNAGAPG